MILTLIKTTIIHFVRPEVLKQHILMVIQYKQLPIKEVLWLFLKKIIPLVKK